jgi:glycosyltransferase involved in cell wall biosynthesis
MRILFIADGRSPTAINWIGHFIHRGHEVHLASTYQCVPQLDLASLHILPTAFSRMGASTSMGESNERSSLIKRLLNTSMRTKIRQRIIPLTLPRAAKALSRILEETRPNLVHALRIPYEGMITALADPKIPMIISVWGNDFTLQARATRLMSGYTRKAARRTDALMADCQRDIRLAHEWGFPEGRPAIVLPGGGGVQLDIFFPPDEPVSAPVVIHPRGLRAYIRNDTFFHAIPHVLGKCPEARFLCAAMQGEPQAERWVADLEIEDTVTLLPRLDREEVADLFRRGAVVVSPSEHDGAPNSLIEAMACGCFPVAGDIESVREWIRHGENGLLVDPADPQALAEAILTALEDDELRAKSRPDNMQLVAERAEYGAVMRKAETFYQMVVESTENRKGR